MGMTSMVDTVLDRSIALGYGSPGLRLRRRLPGWPADGERMDGKVVLVTGAASGIGLAAAAGFARLGASVRALARGAERADEASRLVMARLGGKGEVRPVVCDVSDLASLRAFGERFREQEERLDVLVNNAGVMPDTREHSADGVELTFATHVLAPWVLTEELRPLLREAAPSVVVNVVSGGQYGQRLPAGDPQSARTSYSPKKIYARTKRAELVLTGQWADRLRGDGVHVHAMHPGWADTKGVRNWLPVFRALTRPVIRSPEEGADTVVWLGSSPEALRAGGVFWHDRRPRPFTYAAGPGPDDAAAREELWGYVEELAHRDGDANH
ncbi:SDR family NAD(P)-dependent oxidoreductase [Streptomyces montanisoli]|uniref:SDR family NAD(P)-dependent oxidoreductase n=1 Tax=Streptomyces montanisoli TaxID=2798581 RepID=A0A940MFP6_9ACTN|nr:SDR family NAD(P)-dependent oxidoreductase [Streptomyces montanisoli]MBP0459461.1 SDR family NAD(P)-dependent oxidoreductase [Streptomyces montanisoli]